MPVVQVVHRPREPETEFGPLVLQLMRIRGHRRVQRDARGEADSGSKRAGKADPDEQQAAGPVIPELAKPALAPAVAVVLEVFSAEHQPAVHEPVDPVLGQRRHEDRDPGAEEDFLTSADGHAGLRRNPLCCDAARNTRSWIAYRKTPRPPEANAAAGRPVRVNPRRRRAVPASRRMRVPAP
jgi:hypothetical protein